jgi:nickel-dependent lactate racemase
MGISVTYAYAPEHTIENAEIGGLLKDAFSGAQIEGKRVLVVIPDDTRSLPMPALFEALCAVLGSRARELTFLVALGTHPPLTEDRLTQHLGARWKSFTDVNVMQHDWRDSAVLREVGQIDTETVERISGGLLSESIPVRIHRAVLEADQVILLGPVFPHEVVGFSGGHKYLFPGVSGPEMVDQSHWLGALITSTDTIGRKETPVRSLIEHAASMIGTPRMGLSLVMQQKELRGIYVGDVREAWAQAADLSGTLNIHTEERSYRTVISVAPPMYRDLWTAGKCMYKLESVVADGGTLIIHAPLLSEVSATHGRWITDVGYHTRDYFLHQWERYCDVPRSVLAHSTHVKGCGTFVDGVETPRIDVRLATAIPESVCQRINLGYEDPESIRISEFANNEDRDTLLVPNAGEILWRRKDSTGQSLEDK